MKVQSGVCHGYARFENLMNLSPLSLHFRQAHPKYGTILASSSYDSRVLIWREQSSQWQLISTFTQHTASVNLISWSPHELGCLLACASSDGQVSVLEFREGNWSTFIFPAHGMGVNAVSWAPAVAPGSLVRRDAGGEGPQRRLVTGGSDCVVKIWSFNPQTQGYDQTNTLTGHTDWVRDVAWAPTVLSKSYIASASQDKTVRIWTREPRTEGDWKCTVLPEFEAVVWRVSWSLSGNVLAVSCGDNRVSLWKEDLKGNWDCVKTIEE